MIASVRIVCPMYDPFLRSEGRLATPRKTCTASETFPGLNEKASHARMLEVTRCCTIEAIRASRLRDHSNTDEGCDNEDEPGCALEPQTDWAALDALPSERENTLVEDHEVNTFACT